jgi:hypothetical protein
VQSLVSILSTVAALGNGSRYKGPVTFYIYYSHSRDRVPSNPSTDSCTFLLKRRGLV